MSNLMVHLNTCILLKTGKVVCDLADHNGIVNCKVQNWFVDVLTKQV